MLFCICLGHILDDQDLVETLKKSKVMSAEMRVRVEQSEEAEKKLNQARQKYLPVSPGRIEIGMCPMNGKKSHSFCAFLESQFRFVLPLFWA